MSLYLTPHTHEWFAALDEFDPAQAAVTRHFLKVASRVDVCGDKNAINYNAISKELTIHPASTMRLCVACRDLRAAVLRGKYIPLESLG